MDREYFMQEILSRFRKLTETMEPLWGRMSPQQMVEHIVGSWRISNGRTQLPVGISKEESDRRKATLMTDDPYPQNIMNPIYKEGLPPLRKPDLQSAIDQLEDEMKAFFDHHKGDERVENHPVYGPLTTSEWLHFQRKHTEHHLAQFGV